MDLNWTALTVFVLFFGLVTFIGFAAARWRRGDLNLLHEWGLGGKRFGTIVVWFLLGGDLYTAYTFIALPALAFGAGAVAFFAVPYTILIYPFVFVVFPRLWSVAHRHGYVTAADFVRGRYGDRWLALAIAATGIVATMPYIALQLVGIEVVIAAMGVQLTGFLHDLPLIIAFGILAAFTYSSGLRAPAAIAIVKDVMIYVTVAAALVYIPSQFGGWANVFAAVPPEKLLLAPPTDTTFGGYSSYATLALGSALALFLYPHSVTGILSSSNRNVIRRNAALLPAYSLLLALITLLGYVAIAAGVDKVDTYKGAFVEFGANFAVPALFLEMFPDWFAGFAFAAIGIGALVPAAIMSIAAANLFTRNVYREFIHTDCTPQRESQMAKWTSLVVKFGALIFIVFLPTRYAIELQLLGGIWIIQTLPAVVLGLYTRWLDPRALLAGWAAGIVSGTWMAASVNFAANVPVTIFGIEISAYSAVYSLLINLAIACVLSPVLRSATRTDETSPADYTTQ